MIQSFRCKHTQALFEGGSPGRFRAFENIAIRKLTPLDAAQTLDFLRSPPGSRIEALTGDRQGFASTWLALQAMYDLKTLPTRDEIMAAVTPRPLEPVF